MSMEITDPVMLLEKVQEILTAVKLPDRHTFFQIEKFMVGKEPTAQGQLWQIVREMEARVETLDSYQIQLEDAEDTLEFLDLKIERNARKIKRESDVSSTDSDLNIQACEINIRRLRRQKSELAKAARKVRKKYQSVLEELAFLALGYDKIVAKVGEIRPLDDDEAQREYWNEKLLEELNLRVILQRPLEPDFVRTALSLDDGSPVKAQVIALINNIQQKLVAEKPQVETKARIQGS